MNQAVGKRVTAFKDGNENAFEELVHQYEGMIYSHCYRMIGNRHDAEEFTQETFLKAYKNINSCQDHEKFQAWLHRIATNVTIDYMRKKKPSVILDDEIKDCQDITYTDQLRSKEPLPEEECAKNEKRKLICEAIYQLPEKYQAVIFLRYCEDYSLEDISKALFLPVGTVKTHLHRSKQALHKLIISNPHVASSLFD
ncbi:RNA polymerase sigma factor SigW [Halalkalibacillus halophilus]|uniref:RNA polymerase sigma factor SigW n=1 Tax=Halalkalibacillus halophilus TaxID=392827 RepID=UPI0003FD39F9|nr:RNA polymerase sigma factor SigW [Halalkalibacillus halophilus]